MSQQKAIVTDIEESQLEKLGENSTPNLVKGFNQGGETDLERTTSFVSNKTLGDFDGESLLVNEPLVDHLTALDKNSKWELKSDEVVDFFTYHPQGMTKIDDETLFLSSVEIITSTEKFDQPRNGLDRTPGEGEGHLFKLDTEGNLIDSITLSDGDIYHPGGIDYDGQYIWVPVAEYRPNSESIIYRVDPETMEATEVIRFPDHIGGVMRNSDTNTLHGVSWGSRRFYTWHLDENLDVIDAEQDPEALLTPNPSHYIDYQDGEYVGDNLGLFSGLQTYQDAESEEPLELGGLELVDLTDNQPVFQVPVSLWTEADADENELVMTRNPVYVEPTEAGLKAYFMPEDDTSRLYIYEVDVEAETELPTPRSEALPNTHAHNDYEHEYPLFDALSHGFVSVEADIWLYPNDEENLRVAHDPVADPTTLPTLEELYLDPLQDLHEEFDNGGVYADGTPLALLIDLKSEGLPTYQQLDEVLTEYQAESPGLFTTYSQDEAGDYTVTPGAVTPIISGDRPREYMESQEVRYAGYDGRKDDIGTDVDPGFMPLISDNWDNFFTGDLAWDGTGTIPADTEAELNSIVDEVQEEDKMLRFWNLPQDAPSVWEPLYEADVDLVNTDDLEGLSTFIESQLAGDHHQKAPIVIAHRGASGELPPHTLAAYALAIEQGADFIEPDLVITKDGELVSRHDPNLIFSTDVRYHSEFADRLDTEIVGDDRGGTPQDGYFVKDFTLEEVKTLRTIQDQDFRDQSFNGQFEIATLDEIIDLVQEVEAETGRKIGIYPEIKHSEYFNAAGLDIEKALVETLQEHKFTDPDRVYVQSFQVESLTKLQDLMAGTPLEDTPLVQLYGDPTAQPHDIIKNFSNPDFDPTSVYGTDQIDGDTTYGDLINLDDDPNVNLLADFVTTYADAIGPNEDWVYVTEKLDEPVDANGDGIAQVTQQLTGEVLPVIDDAHEAGLDVHIWTFRNEERYQLLDAQGNVESPEEALTRVIESGADGFFTDFPATGVRVRDRLASDVLPDDETPFFGTRDRDTLEIEGSNQLVFAGEGDDLIDASLAKGNNRIYGDGGDDTFILGSGDRVVGAEGADRFFATSSGDNIMTGGPGADQFWIATAEVPNAANMITDFDLGVDVLGIAGLNLDFKNLSIVQDGKNALVGTNTQDLVSLSGVNSSTLSADNFAFI